MNSDFIQVRSTIPVTHTHRHKVLSFLNALKHFLTPHPYDCNSCLREIVCCLSHQSSVSWQHCLQNNPPPWRFLRCSAERLSGGFWVWKRAPEFMRLCTNSCARPRVKRERACVCVTALHVHGRAPAALTRSVILWHRPRGKLPLSQVVTRVSHWRPAFFFLCCVTFYLPPAFSHLLPPLGSQDCLNFGCNDFWTACAREFPHDYCLTHTVDTYSLLTGQPQPLLESLRRARTKSSPTFPPRRPARPIYTCNCQVSFRFFNFSTMQ